MSYYIFIIFLKSLKGLDKTIIISIQAVLMNSFLIFYVLNT